MSIHMGVYTGNILLGNTRVNSLGDWPDMPKDENFALTSNDVAAQVPCDAGTVRDYADWGWVEHRRLASGVRLFQPSAVAQVRKLRAERLASRGRRPAVGTPA
jgi:hypothetical protein